MSDTPRAFIYDADEGRALVVGADGDAPLGLVRLGPLLAHVRGAGREAALRQFAADVAGGLRWADADLVEAAWRAARGEATADDLAAVREQKRGVATAASAIGLRHGAANAASFMSAYEACAPDAYAAAAGASRMAVLFAELHGDDAAETTRAHIDRLLDALPR